MTQLIVLLTIILLVMHEPTPMVSPNHGPDKTAKTHQHTRKMNQVCITSKQPTKKGIQLAIYIQNNCEILDMQRATPKSLSA